MTSTTVGYGDVALTTQASRLWAAMQILLSVSWLASLLRHMSDTHRLRKHQLQRKVLPHAPHR